MLINSRVMQVGLPREKSNSELFLGVLFQRASLLSQEHAARTEVLMRGRLRHVGLLRGSSDSELCLGVLPRRA